MEKVTLVVADDHFIVRKAIAQILQETEFELIGEMKNGIELLEFVKKTVPDFAIVDLEMPQMDGYEVISKLHKIFSNIKLIAFSGFLDSHNQKRAIKLGADATVSKSEPTSIPSQKF